MEITKISNDDDRKTTTDNIVFGQCYIKCPEVPNPTIYMKLENVGESVEMKNGSIVNHEKIPVIAIFVEAKWRKLR